jgi:DNA-binding XRE family transcriptional regulator
MKQHIPASERQALLFKLLKQQMLHEIHQGEVLRTIRKEVLHMSQTEYASLVGVSRRTLSDIERGANSPAQDIINKIFRPLGLQAGLVPANPTLANKFLNQGSSPDNDNI